MKTINIDYQEYIEMCELIEKQSALIKELEKQPNVIIIDKRNPQYFNMVEFKMANIPEIISTVDEAKQLMKDEFDQIYKDYNSLNSQLRELQAKQIKPVKKGFWS